MRSFLRIVYRGMIRLYPASFRSEFGEEILWIFDEEARRGRVAPLLLDAARSIVGQRVRPRTKVTAAAVPYYVEIDSALPVQRFAQATLVFVYLAFCMAILIAPWVPKLSRATQNSWLLTHVRIVASVPYAGAGKM